MGTPFTLYAATEPFITRGIDDYTAVLLHFDGADGSTSIIDNNHATTRIWTPFGNAQIDTAQSKFGGASGLFDGTGDYISTPDDDAFTLSDNDFTIDFWFKPNNAGGNFIALAGQCVSVGAWGVILLPSNNVRAQVFKGGVETALDGTTQFTSALNNGWHHLAFIRAGNTLKLFIDGVQEGSNVSFTGEVDNVTDVLTVGARPRDGLPPWNGWIDEFRFSPGVARWTNNFTPPTSPYVPDGFTRVLLHFDGPDASTSFPDSEAFSSHTWVANGNAQIDTAQSRFGGASCLFDGSGDWVETPDHPDFALSDQDFTIDFWFNCVEPTGGFKHICGQRQEDFGVGNSSFYIERAPTGEIIAAVESGGSYIAVGGTTQYSNVLNTGWHHCAFVRSGTSLKLYLDGIAENSGFISGSVRDSTQPLRVGRNGGGGFEWNGWIDEFRFSPGIARWTSNFSVPTAAGFTDMPANQPFEGTLEASFRFDRSIINQNGFGGLSESVSELSLINADAQYDDLASNVTMNGQTVSVSVGTTENDGITVSRYSQFQSVAVLTAERFLIDRTRVTIEMRDPMARLQTETVQQSLYGGTGDLDGDDQLAGKRKPFVDGHVFNITPTLVLAAELLYQVNDGAVSLIGAVRDGGISLAFFADYANVAALRSAHASIPPGYYGTSIADGYFLLGGAPQKQITASVNGLHNTTAEIIGFAAIAALGFTVADLDMAAFDTLNVDQPAIVGYFLDQESSESCADTFTKLMNGIGGWVGMTQFGKLTVGRFTAPDPAESIASYDTNAGDLLSIDGIALPDGVDPPPHRRRVSYEHNWTQMTDLFGQIVENDPALADRLRGPYLLAATSEAESNAILADYPNAPDPDPIIAYFNDQADALAEAERLSTLYTQGYSLFRFVIKNAMFVHQIGDVVTVTDSRLGLSGGRALRIVSIVDDLSNMSTELVGFG